MSAKIIRKSDVYKLGPLVSGAIIAALQVGAANALINPAPATLTDSSTGTASAATPPAIATLALPVAFTHVTGTDLAPKAGFDTAMAASYDAAKALAEWVNALRTRLDLPLITYTGTPTTSGTISAQTKSLTGVDGSATGAVDATTGIAELKKARANLRVITRAANEVLNAIGATPISRFQPSNDGLAMTANAATASGVSGAANAQSLSDTAVDAFLNDLANAYATLADQLKKAVAGTTRAKPKYVYLGSQN